jgi:Zn-dependent protease with chaperone function
MDDLAMQAAATTPDPLELVVAELRGLAGDAPLPMVVLTDRAVSSARSRRPWRPASIAIRRELAHRGPSDALRGELAHEYAHILRPHTWQHLVFLLLGVELGSVGVVLFLAGVIAPWFDRPDRLLWLGCWLLGIVLVCAGACCNAWASRRRELRADALAAALLGDSQPVFAFLDEMQARHVGIGRLGRLESLLTHPSPDRRRRELCAASSEVPLRPSTAEAPTR